MLVAQMWGSISKPMEKRRSSIANRLSGSAMATTRTFPSLLMGTTSYRLATSGGTSLTISPSMAISSRLMLSTLCCFARFSFRSASEMAFNLTRL